MDRPAPSPRPGSHSCKAARPGTPVLPLATLREPARALHAAAALRHGLPATPRRRTGPPLPVVSGLSRRHPEAVGGARVKTASATTWRQYDGEIAAVDEQVGRVLEALSGLRGPGLDAPRPHLRPRGEPRASTTTTSITARTCSIRRCAFPCSWSAPGARPGSEEPRPRLDPRPRAHDPRRGEGLVSARSGRRRACSRRWKARRRNRAPGSSRRTTAT